MAGKLWRSAWFWGAAVLLLAGVILSGIYLHYTSPEAVRTMVLERAASVLNGKLHVGDARMQLFRGLRLWDVRLSSSDPSDPEIVVERIRCDWNSAAFAHGDVEPTRLVFRRPRVRLVLDENGNANLKRFFSGRRDPGRTANRTPDRRGTDPNLPYERYFSEGVFVESGELAWTAPAAFGDGRPRLFRGVDVEMQRSSETLERWNITALIREPPLSGTRIQGWLDLADGGERAVFHGAAEELDITPDLLALLPAGAHRALSRLAMAGKVSADALVDYGCDRPTNYTLEVRLRNVDARLRASDLSVRSLDARLRFDRAGFSCDAVSGMLWDGALQAGAASHPDGGATVWLKIEQADLARMADELNLRDRELRGRLDGSAKLKFHRASPAGWSAEGNVSVSNAFLAKLPVLTRAFALLKLRWPGGEVFDRGDCRFSIWENKIYIESLNVSSPSVEITASGTIGLDGTADLVLLVAGSEREKGWIIMRPLRAVIKGIERQIMPPVAVTGPLSDPKVRLLAMEPLKRQFRNLGDLLPFVGELRKAAE